MPRPSPRTNRARLVPHLRGEGRGREGLPQGGGGGTGRDEEERGSHWRSKCLSRARGVARPALTRGAGRARGLQHRCRAQRQRRRGSRARGPRGQRGWSARGRWAMLRPCPPLSALVCPAPYRTDRDGARSAAGLVRLHTGARRGRVHPTGVAARRAESRLLHCRRAHPPPSIRTPPLSHYCSRRRSSHPPPPFLPPIHPPLPTALPYCRPHGAVRSRRLLDEWPRPPDLYSHKPDADPPCSVQSGRGCYPTHPAVPPPRPVHRNGCRVGRRQPKLLHHRPRRAGK